MHSTNRVKKQKGLPVYLKQPVTSFCFSTLGKLLINGFYMCITVWFSLVRPCFLIDCSVMMYLPAGDVLIT